MYAVRTLRGDVLRTYDLTEEYRDEYPRPHLGPILDDLVKAEGWTADDVWTIYDHLVTANEWLDFRRAMMLAGLSESMASFLWDYQSVPDPLTTYMLCCVPT